MNTVTITHTHAEGTLIDSTSKGDGTADVLKANGWRWGYSISVWFVPQSRDRLPKLHIITRTKTALEAAGFVVEPEIDSTYRPMAEVEAGKIGSDQYSPERADFQDFDSFWEFVAGPINAGSFGPNQMDGTFGPSVEFSKAGSYANESPRSGENQYFGHVELGEEDVFSVSLRNANGAVVWSKELHPER